MTPRLGADVSWRIEGRDLIMWSERYHLALEVPYRMAMLQAILDGIPGFVWRQHGVAVSACTVTTRHDHPVAR